MHVLFTCWFWLITVLCPISIYIHSFIIVSCYALNMFFPVCRSRNFIGISFLFVAVKYFRFRNEDEKNWSINFKWFPKRYLVVLSTNWHPWNYFRPDGHKQKARNSKHQRILVFSSFRSFFYFGLIFFPVLQLSFPKSLLQKTVNFIKIVQFFKKRRASINN